MNSSLSKLKSEMISHQVQKVVGNSSKASSTADGCEWGKTKFVIIALTLCWLLPRHAKRMFRDSWLKSLVMHKL